MESENTSTGVNTNPERINCSLIKIKGCQQDNRIIHRLSLANLSLCCINNVITTVHIIFCMDKTTMSVQFAQLISV